MVESVNDHITTDFCLVVQNDGYIINPGAWDDEFLNYDYIGAPWPKLGICGNGGFSLRSKRILELASKLEYTDGIPEDTFYCLHKRSYLMSNNMVFPSPLLAAKFSFESPKRGFDGSSFGFHGKFHLKTVPKL